jgi:hypothetical protein
MRQIDINSSLTDALSPAAYEVLGIGNDSAYSTLVVRGEGNRQAAGRLRGMKAQELLTRPIVSQLDADAMLAGLWLWHDWLDSSHTISQSIPSATGSFWHAIMHRREGDFSNSKYWFARCREHPVLRSVGQAAGDVLNAQPADKSLLRLTRNGWDPDALVDLAQEVHDRPGDARHGVAVAVQRLEWRLLFEHCARGASGQ